MYSNTFHCLLMFCFVSLCVLLDDNFATVLGHHPKSVLTRAFVCLFIIMKGIYRGDDLESCGCSCMSSVFALMLMYMCCCPSQWEELGQTSLFGIIACFCGLWSILCLYVARVSMWQDPHLGALSPLSKSVPLLRYSYRIACTLPI